MLTLREAAQRLGVSRQAVHRRIQSGLIQAERDPIPTFPGYRLLINEKELSNYEARTREQDAATT